MNIKMLAIDLDGTLFRDDKTVSNKTISTLKKCRDRNIKIIYATARGNSAQELVPPGLFDGSVRMNGAVAYAYDTPVYKKMISTADVKTFLLTADNANIQISVETDGWNYSNFDFPEEWGPVFMNRNEITDFKNLEIEAEKIWAMPASTEEIEILKEHLPEGFYLITTRDDFFTMIMQKDVCKSNAITALAKHWNITDTEIAVFGDDIPDIDMMQNYSISIAMGNAIDDIKAIAKYICDTNENDGVAKWIEDHILIDF